MALRCRLTASVSDARLHLARPVLNVFACWLTLTPCSQWFRIHRTLNLVAVTAGLIGIALGQALLSNGDAVSPPSYSDMARKALGWLQRTLASVPELLRCVLADSNIPSGVAFL